MNPTHPTLPERKQVEAHEIVDHGKEASQYFRGCGIAYTGYTDVATGIGSNFTEAYEDALEQLATGGWDVDTSSFVLGDPHGYGTDEVDPDTDHEEIFYYVSVRVR